MIEEKFSNQEKSYIKELSKTLSKQVAGEILAEKYAGTKEVLELVGTGAFLAASLVIPNLPKTLGPLLLNKDDPAPWKRFNIPYLKRTLQRLEKQQLVRSRTENGFEVIEITDRGRKKILKTSLDNLEIKAPRSWDGRWRLVSYDVPDQFRSLRLVIREYLKAWGFYPIQESVYLHAYPCEKEVDFLRMYLGAKAYLRIFEVTKIENDREFREFFGVKI